MEIKYPLFLFVFGGLIITTILSVVELLILKQLHFKEIIVTIKSKLHIIFLAIGYLVFTIVSAIYSPFHYDSIIGFSRYDGILTQFVYVSIFVITIIFGRIKKWHVYILGLTMFLFSFLCIFQLLGYNPLGLYPSGYNYYGAFVDYAGEYIGTIGNSDIVSGFLSIGIMLLFAYIIVGNDKKSVILTIPLLLSVVVLLTMKVAAGILAIIVSLLLFCPYIFYKKKNKTWLLVLIFGIIIFVFGIILIYFYDFNKSGTLFEFHEILHGRIEGSFGSSRIKIWTEVLESMKDHFWLGTGPDSMLLWNLEGFSKYVDDIEINIYHGIDVAHNEYLNVMAQQGVLTFLFYISVIIVAILHFFKSKNKDKKLIVFLPVTAYLLQAFFSFSTCMVAPLFWIFLGLIFNESEH